MKSLRSRQRGHRSDEAGEFRNPARKDRFPEINVAKNPVERVLVLVVRRGLEKSASRFRPVVGKLMQIHQRDGLAQPGETPKILGRREALAGTRTSGNGAKSSDGQRRVESTEDGKKVCAERNLQMVDRLGCCLPLFVRAAAPADQAFLTKTSQSRIWLRIRLDFCRKGRIAGPFSRLKEFSA
jgi:hypothetical protein